MKHEEVLQMSFLSKLNNSFTNLVRKYKRATPKQLVMGGVFALALAGAIAGGFASQSNSSAASCSTNNVMYCGASDRGSFINQVRNGDGHNGDLKAVYNYFGLQTEADYNDFATNAKQGTMDRNGTITVEGDVVATGGKSLGRHNYSYTGTPATAVPIPGAGTFYKGTPNQRWTSGTTSMQVMVWFDKETGATKAAFMNSCGNPAPDIVPDKSSATCEKLIKHDVKKNVYQFSVDAGLSGQAKFVKFNYYVNDKLVDTTTSESELTKEITLTKDSKVRVEVVYTLPGTRGTNRIAKSTLCEKLIEFQEEEKFTFACDNLYATTTDNITFRFSVKASHSTNVKLVSADFTLDSKTVAKDVKDKNDKGEFYKDYTFGDEKTHTVTAVVNVEYTKDGKLVKARTQVSKECTEKVTPKQKPVCKYNPKLEPNDPKCKPPVEECKPGIPKGDERCEEQKCEPQDGKGAECELPNTGPAGMAGLFAGVSAFGAVAHRFVTSRRNRQ